MLTKIQFTTLEKHTRNYKWGSIESPYNELKESYRGGILNDLLVFGNEIPVVKKTNFVCYKNSTNN